MSMIGVTLLNQTVVVQDIIEPGSILNNLQKEISSFLQRGSNDGMDISLCSVNTKKMSLSFASAMMRLVMVRNNSATEIRGDRSPISHNTNCDLRFTNHTIDLVKGDTFYIFSDGYCDQFGGKKQKKFMYKRLEKLLLEIHQKDMREQKNILENTHREWRGNLEQVDDILVIGFRV